MRIFLPLLVLLVMLSCGYDRPSDLGIGTVAYESADSLLVMDRLERFDGTSLESSLLFSKIGQSFLGTPYLSHSLENNQEEILVVNLQGFDCTTFVESCLALKQCVTDEELAFNAYLKNLKTIRYRYGKIDGYSSRLHYFTDWIFDNSQLGLVVDVTEENGGVYYENKLDFMSTHPEAYKQLKDNADLVAAIADLEKVISGRDYYYIPKDELADAENKLAEGDIVAFTTYIGGLDVVHTGITVGHEGRIHLLHASSDAGKVVISEKPLVDYMRENKLQTGVILLKVN